MSSGSRYFGLLLRLLPERFRATRGSDLLALFAEMRRELGPTPGLVRLTGFHVRVTLDVIQRAVVARVRGRRRGTIEAAARSGVPGHSLRPGMARRTFLRLSGLRRDAGIAFRGLRKAPGFSLLAVLTMTLAIGANTAVFTILHAVVLKSLPYLEPDRIVMLAESNVSRGWESFRVSPPDYWDWQARNRSMETLAAYQESAVSFSVGGQARSANAFRVSEGFLRVLEARPFLGRGFAREDMDPGSKPVVVLSFVLWTSVFGRDPGVIGREVLLEGRKHTVLGVMGKEWRGFSRREVDLLIPLQPQPYWYTARGSHLLLGLGRLKAGTSVRQAQADFSAIAAQLEIEHPETNSGWGAAVLPLRDVVLGDSDTQLVLFMLSAGLVLVIACANLANMILSRAMGRDREFAVRMALGAGRGRLSQQLLTETLVLTASGGVLGLLLAHVAVSTVVRTWPDLLPRLAEVHMDVAVVLFTTGLVLASALLSGLLPALSAARSGVRQTIRGGGAGQIGTRTRRVASGTLVVAEVALAVVLLAGSGLLLRSYRAMEAENPGFEARDRVFAVTSLAPGKYTTPDEVREFERRMLAGMQRLPGVRKAAVSSILPLEGGNNIWGFWIDGKPVDPGNSDGSAILYRVSPGYLPAMGIPLLAGRGIDESDRPDSRRVVVVSQSLATKQFPDGPALGRRLLFDPEDESYSATVVGVVGDVRHDELTRTSLPQAYVPFSQFPTREVGMVLEGSAGTRAFASGLRRTIAEVDSDQPLTRVLSGDALMAGTTALPRFRSFLMTAFGLTGLLLSVMGLYGVLSHGVSRRRREFGVRMAIGASRGSILGLVVREGVPLLALGLLAGFLGSLALGRALESMLFGVTPTDPVVLLAVPLLLAIVAMVAMLVPARGAAATDPVRVLGQQ